MPKTYQTVILSSKSPLRASVNFTEDLPRDISPLRKRTPTRDSMRTRLSHGSPGSRRFQRWSNSQIGDIEDEVVIMEEFEPEQPSHFSSITCEGKEREAWKPFVDVTEDTQARLLAELRIVMQQSTELRVRSALKPLSASDCFHRLDKHIRITLRKYTGGYLSILEDAILNFVETGEVSSSIDVPFTVNDHALVLVFDSPFLRLLCHAVCQFHAIPSQSQDLPKGKRATMVIRPKMRHSHAQLSLANYLDTKQRAA